jgi:hypothetical protein
LTKVKPYLTSTSALLESRTVVTENELRANKKIGANFW